LGDPPLQGQGAVAEHYVAAVVERAARFATALAASADLLAVPED
jgi:mannitol/fructose-specific phosphotransferase system IIA component